MVVANQPSLAGRAEWIKTFSLGVNAEWRVRSNVADYQGDWFGTFSIAAIIFNNL